MPSKKKRATKTAKKTAKKRATKTAKKSAKSAKSANKTQATPASVDAFIGRIDAARRDDAKEVARIMERVTGEKPRMWGSSIVGFGNVHYKYESGREGDTALVGFAPRKDALTLYLWGDVFGEPAMQKLGKFKTGKGCLYVKSLKDVDAAVLEELIATSAAKLRARYG